MHDTKIGAGSCHTYHDYKIQRLQRMEDRSFSLFFGNTGTNQISLRQTSLPASRTQRAWLSWAGSPDRVIPGHDALQFQRFPTEGRIAKIR